MVCKFILNGFWEADVLAKEADLQTSSFTNDTPISASDILFTVHILSLEVI